MDRKDMQKLNREKVSKSKSFGTGLFDTYTYGLLPNVAAYLGQNPNLPYEELRDEIRKEQQQRFQDNPISYALGGVTGAIAPSPARYIPKVNEVARNITQSGAKSGSLYGLLSTDFNLQEPIEEQLPGAAFNTATGGIAGKAGELLGNAVVGATKKLIPKVKNAGQEAMQELANKFGIPLTRGNFDPEANIVEKAASQNKFGDINQQLSQNIQQEQQGAIQKAVKNQAQEIAKAPVSTTKGEYLENPVQKLQKLSEKGIEKYKNAYAEAQGQKGYLLFDDTIKQFPKELEQKLYDSASSPDIAPNVFAHLKNFKRNYTLPKGLKEGDKVIGVDLNKLETWRSTLGDILADAYNKANPNRKEGRAAAIALEDFDGFLDKLANDTLYRGDLKSLEKFKEARGLYKDWAQTFNSSDSKDFGKKFIREVVNNKHLTNEEVANYAFGLSDLGFSDRSASIMKQLKQTLGADSPEFNAFKIESVRRLLKPLVTSNDFKKPEYISYLNNLEKLTTNKDSFLKEIFTPDEIKNLGDLGKVIAQIESPKINKIAPSNTPFVAETLEKAAESTAIGKVLNGWRKDTRINKQLRDYIANPVGKQPKYKIPEKIQETVKKVPQAPILQKTFENKPGENNQPNIIEKIGKVESGNDYTAKSPTSSAFGKYQFTKSTWNDLVKNHPELKLTMADITKPEAQEKAIKVLTNENTANLSDFLGRKPNDTEVYLAHFLGAGGAKKFLQSNKNQLAVKIFPREAKANKAIFFNGSKPRTMAEVYQLLKTKLA